MWPLGGENANILFFLSKSFMPWCFYVWFTFWSPHYSKLLSSLSPLFDTCFNVFTLLMPHFPHIYSVTALSLLLHFSLPFVQVWPCEYLCLSPHSQTYMSRTPAGENRYQGCVHLFFFFFLVQPLTEFSALQILVVSVLLWWIKLWSLLVLKRYGQHQTWGS